MATLKEIRLRIATTKNMQKITKAMKMVSAAKLRKAQEKIISTRPYANKLNELFHHVISVSEDKNNPLLEEREINTVLVVVITSDRGLCGSFNANITKYANKYINEINKAVKVITIGKKAGDYFGKRNYNLIEKFNGFFAHLNIDDSTKLVNNIVKGYNEKEYDKVVLIYNEFKSVAKQVISCQQFLPLHSDIVKEAPVSGNQVDYIYEPSSKEILNSLIPKQLNMQFWKSLLESNASEHGARMTAMEIATNNASDLLKYLGLQYNRARQDSITTELLEIVAGAEALQKG